MAVAIQVDDSRVVIALGKFRLSLAQNQQLMEQIGASQLVSVRRTFRDEGVPAHSWVPLAPSTIRSLGDKAVGHKLLVRSGRLLNSINAQAQPGKVVIGTNLVYAAVHQFGSRDRRTAIGPRTQAESGTTVGVKEHSYFRMQGELGAGKLPHAGRRKIQGPRNGRRVNVSAHRRQQNIPPRPYLVFRAEDPARIRGIITRYIDKAKQEAGLGGGQ